MRLLYLRLLCLLGVIEKSQAVVKLVNQGQFGLANRLLEDQFEVHP